MPLGKLTVHLEDIELKTYATDIPRPFQLQTHQEPRHLPEKHS
jgi:hypothetical protein